MCRRSRQREALAEVSVGGTVSVPTNWRPRLWSKVDVSTETVSRINHLVHPVCAMYVCMHATRDFVTQLVRDCAYMSRGKTPKGSHLHG